MLGLELEEGDTEELSATSDSTDWENEMSGLELRAQTEGGINGAERRKQKNKKKEPKKNKTAYLD